MLRLGRGRPLLAPLPRHRERGHHGGDRYETHTQGTNKYLPLLDSEGVASAPHRGRIRAALAYFGFSTQLTASATREATMRLLLQRSIEPVPYLGAFFRIAGTEADPARASLVLSPDPGEPGDEEVLARLLGLALALGDPVGGPPIRQFWLEEDLRFAGRMESPLAPATAGRAEALARRVREEWRRFLGNALARLRGETRGDAHFRFPGGAWSPERPAVLVTAWPPLPGEALPELD